MFFFLLGFIKVSLRSCAEALGMHNGLISDATITASSSYQSTKAPQLGRLHYLMSGSGTQGCWMPATNNKYQWLQVDMGNWTRVTGVATQGKQNYDRWVKSYSLSTSDGEFFEFLKTNSGVKKVSLITAGNFIHSFIHLLTHSFIHSFIYLFTSLENSQSKLHYGVQKKKKKNK